MQWIGITVPTPTAETEDAVTQLLLSAGCGGVALSGEGGQRLVTSYLPADQEDDHRRQQIVAALTLLPSIGITDAGVPSFSRIDEQDWANSWKAYFKPIRIGKRLVVSPPWENPELSASDMLITIDPGMAFGTGTHATTQMCLVLLEEYLRTGETVADIGTGSGILSIAAMKLGASSVVAVDNDPLAVKIARENALVNSVDIHADDHLPAGETYDLVVANIIADTLIELAGLFTTIVRPKGVLIVSGVIDHRQNDVRAATVGPEFEFIETRNEGEWASLVFRRILPAQ
jgi:ribosomal protein L11 methyltransferase